MSDNSERLAARYGNTPQRAARNKAWAWTAASGFALVLGAWLWWGGLLEAPSQLQYRDLGHTIVSGTDVVVNYELTTAPGTQVTCAIQALNASYGIVGWQIVDIPASEQWTRVFETPLRTSEPAVTGLLYECWLT
jgi:hypothetical protein